MSAQQLCVGLAIWACLTHTAAASLQAERQTCPLDDEMPVDTRKLMQVASERKTQHPGTGKVLPLSAQDKAGEKAFQEGSEQKVKEATLDSPPVFGWKALGAVAFPVDVSELPQLPLLDQMKPTEGGGAVVFFTLLVLVLVCSLAVLTCFGEDLDAEEVARARPSPPKLLKPPGEDAVYHVGSSALSSATTAEVGSQQVSSSFYQSWQDSRDAQAAAQSSQSFQPAVQAPQAQPVTASKTTEAAFAQRPWASSYLPEVPRAEPVPKPQENIPNLPPMLSAFPPVWGGGPSPVAEEVEENQASSPSSQPPTGDQEVPVALAPLTFANLTGEASSQTIFGEGIVVDPNLDATGMLCPGMMVDPSSECTMAVPIADPDMPALSMTILALDQRPVLKAEVYRGQECQAPEYFSPMIGEFWPPENVSLISTYRGNQQPSVVLTSLPPENQRSDDLEVDNEEDVQILSASYLVQSDEQSLEFDIYNGSGEFFGRLGRDHSRSCRFMMRGGNFGEVRYFVDGVFEDYAVLFTDMCHDTVADGEAFESCDLPFPEAAGCIRLRIHGSQAVDAGLILTMLFCAYELRSLGA